MLYLAVLTGALINLLLGLNEALKKTDYSFSIFFKQNIIATLLNIIIGFSIIFGKEDPLVKQLIGDITFLMAVFVGSSGQFLWKKITNILSPEKQTAIGINK